MCVCVCVCVCDVLFYMLWNIKTYKNNHYAVVKTSEYPGRGGGYHLLTWSEILFLIFFLTFQGQNIFLIFRNILFSEKVTPSP